MAFIKKNKWIFVLLLATLVWGLSFVTQVKGSENIGKFWFNGIRFMLGGVVLLIPALIMERKEYHGKTFWKTIIFGMICGVFLFGAVSFQQAGITITRSPGIAAFITDMYAILVPIFCRLFFKKKTGINLWIGIILTTIGLFFLCVLNVSADDGFYVEASKMFLGESILCLCTLCFAFHVLATDRLGDNVPTLLFSISQFITVGALSIIVGLFAEDVSFGMVKGAAIPILYCGIFSVGVGYTCQILGQKHVNPSLCVVIFALESVFSTIFGIIFGMDRMNFYTALGCILILAGIIIGQLNNKEKNETSDNV